MVKVFIFFWPVKYFCHNPIVSRKVYYVGFEIFLRERRNVNKLASNSRIRVDFRWNNENCKTQFRQTYIFNCVLDNRLWVLDIRRICNVMKHLNRGSGEVFTENKTLVDLFTVKRTLISTTRRANIHMTIIGRTNYAIWL